MSLTVGDRSQSNFPLLNTDDSHSAKKQNQFNIFGNNKEQKYLDNILKQNGGIVPVGCGYIQ